MKGQYGAYKLEHWSGSQKTGAVVLAWLLTGSRRQQEV